MAETSNERVISVIGANALEMEAPKEEALREQTTDLEIRAAEVLVRNDQEYEQAAEFGKMLKAKAAEVTSFFKPMKDAAHKAHKQVCDREKEMLAPLSKAEKIVKQAMGDYITEKERRRREAEEAARRAAEEEAKRRLAEAIDLDEQGNAEAADAAIEEAQIMESAAANVFAAQSTPKLKGVSSSKDWEITGINAAQVPINFSGVELRPVDKAAIMRLIRASKGSIQIPGVQYVERAKMSFSRR